jgi:caffeoyl-CoA O-methyltransferase
MKIINTKIDCYLMSTLPERDKVQKEMEAFARKNDFPIIGPLVGRFLCQLALITGAKSIFEMGSGFGYSAYWFAGGMPEGGKIICTDQSEENCQKGIAFLDKGGLADKVEFHVGDALEIMEKFKGPFDIILNDIDKLFYPRALDLAIPRLRCGGIFITDNVLWSGQILHKKPTAASRAILEFNRRLFSSEDIFSSILPISDGLGMAIKIR